MAIPAYQVMWVFAFAMIAVAIRLKTLSPARIGIRQRVVPHVRIPVHALRRVRKLHQRVRRQEHPDLRVVHPAVHVDQPDHPVRVLRVLQVLVARVAARQAVQGGGEQPGAGGGGLPGGGAGGEVMTATYCGYMDTYCGSIRLRRLPRRLP